MSVSRRAFLSTSATVVAALSARPELAAARTGSQARFSPLLAPDRNGIALPAGFTSRVVARSGQSVTRSNYMWHLYPDGGACFATDDGGWIYVSNAETFGAADGGAGAITFDRRGTITGGHAILTGTSRNCAGGATPWGTWLSCEEHPTGQAWECDPRGRYPGVARPALGRFAHEAVAVDSSGRLYLTEDQPDGRLYRFTPRHRKDLRSGRLEAARVDSDRVRWITIPDPSAAETPTRHQVPETTPFQGGEGIWWTDGAALFVTKHDRKLWRLDTQHGHISVLHDALGAGNNGVLGEPDNVTVTDRGDVFITEDQGADQQVVLVTRSGAVLPILQLAEQPGSELTGIAFNPHGNRMYISSQRGSDRAPGSGITYEISGPFHGRQKSQWRRGRQKQQPRGHNDGDGHRRDRDKRDRED